MTNNHIRAALIVIGNEILSGRTQDQNVNFIAQRLASVGISLCEARIIPDIKNVIIDTLRTLSKSYDYVFTTGGIGPTHDDITSESVAEAFGVEYDLHPEAYQIISDYYESLGREVNPASKKMAYIPSGAKLLHNPVSGAPGFIVENVYTLPGIPNIMQAMLDLILPSLKHRPAIKSKALDLLVGESVIADILSSVQAEYPQVDVGSYPFIDGGRHATSIVLTSSEHASLETAHNKLTKLLQEYQRIN